jgi:hypothetical protein
MVEPGPFPVHQKPALAIIEEDIARLRVTLAGHSDMWDRHGGQPFYYRAERVVGKAVDDDVVGRLGRQV